MQGLAGGGMTPVAQSILAAAFPPAKRSQGFALYGIAVVVAPAVGPTLGGWLSDNLSWHWCFLINVPVGLISLVLIYLIIPSSPEKQKERERALGQGTRISTIVGFLLIATFLGALEVVLDRGQIDDWFGSAFIVTFAAISAIALAAVHPVGAQSAAAADRHQDADRTPVRHLLSHHAGDRRAPDRDDADPAAAAAGGIRLHRHAGRSCDLAGRRW